MIDDAVDVLLLRNGAGRAEIQQFLAQLDTGTLSELAGAASTELVYRLMVHEARVKAQSDVKRYIKGGGEIKWTEANDE